MIALGLSRLVRAVTAAQRDSKQSLPVLPPRKRHITLLPWNEAPRKIPRRQVIAKRVAWNLGEKKPGLELADTINFEGIGFELYPPEMKHRSAPQLRYVVLHVLVVVVLCGIVGGNEESLDWCRPVDKVVTHMPLYVVPIYLRGWHARTSDRACQAKEKSLMFPLLGSEE
jgi:hypothetical protein